MVFLKTAPVKLVGETRTPSHKMAPPSALVGRLVAKQFVAPDGSGKKTYVGMVMGVDANGRATVWYSHDDDVEEMDVHVDLQRHLLPEGVAIALKDYRRAGLAVICHAVRKVGRRSRRQVS